LMTDSGNMGKYLANIFGTGQQRTFVAMVDFGEIFGKATGPITAANVQTILTKSCNETSNGLAPVMNFCKENPIPGLARIFNGSLTYLVVKNGAITESTPGFHDVVQYYLAGSAAK
jgi:hypothetical protein